MLFISLSNSYWPVIQCFMVFNVGTGISGGTVKLLNRKSKIFPILAYKTELVVIFWLLSFLSAADISPSSFLLISKVMIIQMQILCFM